MKLKNKKTGEIEKLVGYVKTGDDRMFFRFEDDKGSYKKEYNSLAELNEEWEDYEEPKEYYFIRDDGWSGVGYSPNGNSPVAKHREEIGNYFSTREEAKKAVEKLKAVKQLKDKGFRFEGWYIGCITDGTNNHIDFSCHDGKDWREVKEDLDLLFGGEE